MNQVRQLATLGRPFQLGTLYDCRSDTLIPGVTLWDLQTLQSNLNCCAQPSTEFHIIASDSMEKKAAALNVSGSLKASLLCGLVEVNGSAKYLNDSKQSKRQARVTLQYKTTTRIEELTMSHLGRQNVAYPSVFDEGSATHVVTAVLYGAQAFFVFDQMVSSAENMQDIQGNIEVTIKCLPMIAGQGDAALTMTEVQKSHSEKLSCTFYGDFSLRNNPTTFQDAIGIYASLPSLLGSGGENSVPVSVWLYPLNKLDSKAIQLVREISMGLVNQCQQALEQLNETVQRCNDMMNDSVTIQFPEIRDRIQQFREMCLEYKLVFQRTLARVLPSIRGGEEEGGLLVDILQNKEQSPFKHQSLITWLDDKEWEMMVVRFYLKKLDDIPIVKSRRELDEEVMNPATDYVICFTFTALHQEDLYVLKAIDYLRSHTDQKMQTAAPDNEACASQHGEQWFNSPSTNEKMKDQCQSFLDFATANKENGKIKFLVASVKDDSNRGASIYLYEGGSLINQCFEPPSQPQRPTTIATTHDSVTLQLQPPRHGAGEIVGYTVEYRGWWQEDWSTLHTPDKSHSVIIPGLQLHQEYHFRYRAVTKVGVSKVSDSCRAMTCPTSPPGGPVLQGFSSIGTLSWDGPTQIGTNVKIVQYRTEYREETAVGSNTEGGLSEKIKTTDSQCHYHFEGLKPNTVNRVRVSADCGEAGSRAPSEAVLAKIGNEATRIAQKLRREAKLISKGHPSIYKLKLQKEVFHQSRHFVKCSFGKRNIKCSMKTIMVLGATGSGKTTLINGMINYILGVEWTDNFRYTLIHEETGKSQAESQTSYITAYQLHHQEGFKIDYSLTIIDTPGFGDTRGISQDEQITDNIREFFTSPQGVDQIDAVCFVVQASLARLTHTQKYIFDSILSIFGKDIAESIHVLVTFADGQHPPVLQALQVAEVPCTKDENGRPVHFKFNNSAIFAQRPASGNSTNMGSFDNSGDTEEDDDNFDAMFWKMGENSMKKFFQALTTMKAKSLRLTREVLKERQQLEVAVEGLQIKIRVGLTKLEELRKTQQVMNQHQTDLDANKDFEYEVEITVAVQEDERRSGNYITNCQKCRFTCHYPCQIPNDDEKRGCAAMDRDGYCKICPQKCVWSFHFNQKYRFEYKTKKEKRTYKELKEKYEKACGEKMTTQKVMETLEIELAEVRNAVLELIQQLTQSIRRLEEIALRPNRLSTPAYIDLLIQSEKEEAKPGFMERIQALQEIKEWADFVQKFPEGQKQHTKGSGERIGKTIKKKCADVVTWFTGH
ncbi:uncharacterized protein LOC127585890 isoform X1 [Pristis pectinata]|uniref:uncharacterized protein LOC127585890 isoform X1 n=1 Tax=Pristis pectinata TaxID=685728 RepID=UPI00223CBA74|nr:uncharacterized protein LOC127585890 isoform X1 [Pristis pectinata]XP_051899567.1 uncharacterized protein LOC127585890 isoform X1 [Pristis pectinata]XP_051899568.1 uncharacterized protein LOC127585890 isoform X1 [Pristis pectinata]XP_051899569.1 uncharacterized protein LOC127585890 isoform X1 [Pristis pectinata]XP_051899570.1 uncharacterized protein LOC127585890 isoform X1 [Pristis pectinata]